MMNFNRKNAQLHAHQPQAVAHAIVLPKRNATATFWISAAVALAALLLVGALAAIKSDGSDRDLREPSNTNLNEYMQ